jgi:uncharacterized protein (TIGR03435 family)
MAQLASYVCIWVLRCPVLDKTGLDGFYDFTLKWSAPDPVLEGSAQDDTAFSIFGAVQEQLGLRLTAKKAPTLGITQNRPVGVTSKPAS